MPPKLFQSEILAIEPEMGDASRVTISVPDGMANDIRPGQFMHILPRGEGTLDPLLRRPFSVMRPRPEQNSVDILVRPFGRGSGWIARQKIGASLDVLGLLGNGFSINPSARNLLMVAGGVGAAPLVMLAEEAVAKGMNVTFLMGGATSEALLSASQLPESVEYVVATDDGSKGHHGFVTDLAPNYVPWADQVFTCGPEVMFRSLRRALEPHRLHRKPPIQVSMERSMACGIGACLGCVVETKKGMSASCVDGPVYDLDIIDW